MYENKESPKAYTITEKEVIETRIKEVKKDIEEMKKLLATLELRRNGIK